MGSDHCTHDVRAWLVVNDVPIFRRLFLERAVASFAVRVLTWVESSDIVFVNSVTKVLSACVAVAIFASARVWSCCILVKSSALACAARTFAA